LLCELEGDGVKETPASLRVHPSDTLVRIDKNVLDLEMSAGISMALSHSSIQSCD